MRVLDPPLGKLNDIPFTPWWVAKKVVAAKEAVVAKVDQLRVEEEKRMAQEIYAAAKADVKSKAFPVGIAAAIGGGVLLLYFVFRKKR